MHQDGGGDRQHLVETTLHIDTQLTLLHPVDGGHALAFRVEGNLLLSRVLLFQFVLVHLQLQCRIHDGGLGGITCRLMRSLLRHLQMGIGAEQCAHQQHPFIFVKLLR